MSLVVVDIGNSRMKWGLCSPSRIDALASLPGDDPAAWAVQSDLWRASAWAVASVVPAVRERFAKWLRDAGARPFVVESAKQLPLRVDVDEPERVGIDRLLDAVAVNARRRPNSAVVVVDAGSAVTVDLVDATGAFRGGAIFPGLRLMARSLHDYTAQLPIVDVGQFAAPPGTSTTAAIATGIHHAVVGGIDRLAAELGPADVVLTGGDADLLAPRLTVPATVRHDLTLEGLRLAVVSQTAPPRDR